MRDGAGARRRPSGADASRPVYIISVAAELVSVHPRTLRIYEGEGLVRPARTPSNIRLYSENDLRRILWIRHLTQPARQPRYLASRTLTTPDTITMPDTGITPATITTAGRRARTPAASLSWTGGRR